MKHWSYPSPAPLPKWAPVSVLDKGIHSQFLDQNAEGDARGSLPIIRFPRGRGWQLAVLWTLQSVFSLAFLSSYFLASYVQGSWDSSYCGHLVFPSISPVKVALLWHSLTLLKSCHHCLVKHITIFLGKFLSHPLEKWKRTVNMSLEVSDRAIYCLTCPWSSEIG